MAVYAILYIVKATAMLTYKTHIGSPVAVKLSGAPLPHHNAIIYNNIVNTHFSL